MEPIIAAVDLSSASSGVLKTALFWAKHQNASVTVCHVVPDGLLSQLRSDSYRSKLRNDSEGAMREFCSTCAGSDYFSGYEVLKGKPATQIVAVAEKHEAQLIVIASHGFSTMQQTLIGGEAERIVRRSSIPVLMIRASEDIPRVLDKVRRILVPTDFSESAISATEYAAALARSFHVKMQLLHVINRQIWYDSYLVSAINVNELEHHAEKEAKRKMTKLIRDMDHEGLMVEAIIRHGLPFKEITGFARENPIDLVVMATRGRTSSPDALIGSVAEKVVRHSPCATLTIRPPI